MIDEGNAVHHSILADRVTGADDGEAALRRAAHACTTIATAMRRGRYVARPYDDAAPERIVLEDVERTLPGINVMMGFLQGWSPDHGRLVQRVADALASAAPSDGLEPPGIRSRAIRAIVRGIASGVLPPDDGDPMREYIYRAPSPWRPASIEIRRRASMRRWEDAIPCGDPNDQDTTFSSINASDFDENAAFGGSVLLWSVGSVALRLRPDDLPDPLERMRILIESGLS